MEVKGYNEPQKVFHVVSGLDGCLSIKVKYSNVPRNFKMFELYLRLRRINESYSHIPVEVCKEHQETRSIHPLMPAKSNSTLSYEQLDDGVGTLIVAGLRHAGGVVDDIIQVSITCNDSCIQSGELGKKEGPRDKMLCITLVGLKGQNSLSRRVLKVENILVWSKPTLCARDLNKTQRRSLKGYALQMMKAERKDPQRLMKDQETQTEHSGSLIASNCLCAEMYEALPTYVADMDTRNEDNVESN